ncbi:MAG: Hpt domain-containing protein [Clostridia bacterium]|nr:Hpt domain-containing protein [Clostridia bacterium]
MKEACEAGDLEQGFEAAHSLKGMMANLALTPILQPVEKITELLRARTETDYAPLVEEILEQRRRLAEQL